MFKDKVAEAKAEAERFLKRVDEWEAVQGRTYTHGDHVFTYGTPKQNGALKRSSMDLTRALAELRKPSTNL